MIVQKHITKKNILSSQFLSLSSSHIYKEITTLGHTTSFDDLCPSKRVKGRDPSSTNHDKVERNHNSLHPYLSLLLSFVHHLMWYFERDGFLSKKRCAESEIMDINSLRIFISVHNILKCMYDNTYMCEVYI